MFGDTFLNNFKEKFEKISSKHLRNFENILIKISQKILERRNFTKIYRNFKIEKILKDVINFQEINKKILNDFTAFVQKIIVYLSLKSVFFFKFSSEHSRFSHIYNGDSILMWMR